MFVPLASFANESVWTIFQAYGCSSWQTAHKRYSQEFCFSWKAIISEPKVVDEAVPVIQPNHPHAGSASLWSAAVGGAPASYMKKLLFDVAVSATVA